MNRYTVQHIGYPVATRKIEEHEWITHSIHSSLRAAVKRIKKETSHLDPHTWDDHYRIVTPDDEILDSKEAQYRIQLGKA